MFQVVDGFVEGLKTFRFSSWLTLVVGLSVVAFLFKKRRSNGSKYTSKYIIDKYCDGKSLKGKTAIVTGGNSGIGLETCKALAYAGCRVIMCSRDVTSGEKAIISDIKKNGESGYFVDEPDIAVRALDLADLRSVKNFAESIKSESRIDFLICNAGTMANPKREETKDGFEFQIGVNHFGHAYLIDLLLGKMKMQNFESRIVILASSAHTYGDININDLHYTKGRKYTAWGAYGSSKLANILYAKALSSKLQKDSKIIACSVHPGVILTNLWRNTQIKGTSFWNYLVSSVCNLIIMDKTIAQGAATTLWACLTKDNIRGEYLADCQVLLPNKMAQDKDHVLQLALWDTTQEELKAKRKLFE